MKIRFERFLGEPKLQLRSSAGSQPAVSPISNRQTASQPGAALKFRCVGRLETCAIPILFTALLLAVVSANAATNDLTGIMQKALFEEEGNHNLPAAIEAYQNIISRFDDARATTATAIFRLGECYRKQGKTNEAVAQYQRVITEFRDQNTLATLSEQNLGSLGATASSGSAFSDRLRTLIRSATSEDSSNDTSNTSFAFESLEIKRIQAMIKESPDLINAKETGSGTTPLHRAARSGQLSVIQFLLAHGADIDPKDMMFGGQTPLHYAVGAGHKAVAEVLLNKGASINATDGSGSAPLHLAADRGFRNVVELLLAKGADVNARRQGGVTPLHLAVANGNRSVVELTLASHPALDAVASSFQSFGENFQGTPLHIAVKRSSETLVKMLLDNKAPVDAVDDSGKTALSRAASAGQTNMVALLLDYKADPNFRSPKDTPPGWTPLHDAVDNGQKDSVAMLLQRGADPNARAGLFSWPEQRGASGRGYTPVLMATRKGHESIVETLLRFKADPNTASASGDTPLLTTLDGNHPLAGERVRIFKMLLDHGANPNMPSPHGNTPLILSSIYGEKELVQALIAHKADLDAKNDEGKSALHFLTSGTVNGTFVEIAALLLDAGANPNVQDNGASTPLAYLNRRPTPGIPVGSVGPAESATAKSQMVELLHQHGAVADVPDFTSIRLTRKGGSTATVFRQSTNGMNHFTLFQTIATYYEEPGAHSGYVPGGVLSVCGFYPFPDLPRLKVHRPVKGKLTETQEFPVYVLTETNTFDCAKDTPLEFGDIVEIPEREHGLTEAIVGPTRDQSQSLRTCLARTVTVKVKAGSVELPGASVGVGNCLRELLKQPQVQKLLTSASDLTHVKVTRSEAGGKKREIVENVQVFWDGKAQTWEDVWLRNGDVIEVPDKTELSEKSR